MKHSLDESIIRQYDIRGKFGETLFKEDSFFIGKAFASVVKNANGHSIAVARDGRLSSPELTGSLIDGVTSCGVDVCSVGLVPTPLLYFAVQEFNLDGGIMVTGSHNPKNHNGFKMLLGNKSFYGDDIKGLAKTIEDQLYFQLQHNGQVYQISILDKYVDKVFDKLCFHRLMKVAWDCGNGAASTVIGELSKRIPGRHILLNDQIDGNFPAHSPDPTVNENLSQLQDEVLKNSCDLGIAFDGDADRLVVIDNTGRIISGDQLLCIVARDVLSKNPGSTIIADIKASDIFFDEVKRLGGKPVISATGHSIIRSRIAETGAALAGEMSGHMFFADQWYGFDDGIYSSARLISFLSSQDKPLSVIFDELPRMFNTPEIRIDCPDIQKFKIIKSISQELKSDLSQKTENIDGLRVTNKYGWWLLRASNTQDALVVRAEAKTQDHLTKLECQLKSILLKFGLKY